MGAYVGRSRIHAGNVSLILNLSTGHVSPQFHVVFDETFSTVPSLKNSSVTASWKFIAKIIEKLPQTNISIWHIYGENLSRKVASNSTFKRTQLIKKNQQPKDDALKNCDTEHITDNLVSAVAHKLKSYLEAAKGNLSDTNNNQTFPIRPTLEQGVAVNEGITADESHTAL